MATKEQIKYGSKVRKNMIESKDSLQLLAELNLSKMSERIIKDIMKNKKALADNKAYQATTGIKVIGIAEYKKQLNEALADIVDTTWSMVSDFVGVKPAIKFAKSSFDKLPKSVRDRIKKTNELLIGAQVADLEKAIFFTYDDAIFADLPNKEIISKLEDNAEKFYTGGGVSAGSAKVASTYVNHASNAYYALDEVSDELEALLFYNPKPDAAICVDLAGQYFPVNDPNLDRYTPPLHFNCKSTLLPVLNGQLPKNAKIEKLEPSKTAKKSIQFSEETNLMKFLKEF